MRAVPTAYIKGEVTLAENIYTKEGAILLRNGAKITERIVKKINENGIFTIYISDMYSPDMDIDRIVDISMRIRGVNLTKEIYEKVRAGKTISEDFPKIEALFDGVYDEILAAKDRQINYIDIKSVENYTYGHALNVAILSTLLGIEMGVRMPQLKSLFIGALLHDIGMMFVPADVYAKTEKMEPAELEILKQHVIFAHDYLRKTHEADAFVRNIAMTHHERHNGTGYPLGIRGSEIHLLSQIVGICDIYDAMTSDRVYKRAVAPNEAIEYLMGNAGELFEFEITEKFCKKINPYPEGSLVKLNDGSVAVVKSVVKDLPLRPTLSMIHNVGPKLVFEEIDLYEKRNLVIVEPYY